MNGKTVLVTGANRGVGFVTASRLAMLGAEVVLVCRDGQRGSVAREAIAKIAAQQRQRYVRAARTNSRRH